MTHLITVHKDIAQRLNAVYHDQELSNAHAWWLLESLLGKNRAQLFAMEYLLSDDHVARLQHALHCIINDHMPIQYVIGAVPFLDLLIHVEPPILIPRSETEAWVEQLILNYQKSSSALKRILDLCTGTGCIALSLAHAFPQSPVDAVDCDERAVVLAEKNMTLNNIFNSTFVRGDLFAPLAQGAQYDLIVANPPYIPLDAYHDLDPSVRAWEAEHALTAGVNDLAIIERIISGAPDWLTKNGRLAIEIDATQGVRVVNLFQTYCFSDIHILRDYQHHDRVVTGIYRKSNNGVSS